MKVWTVLPRHHDDIISHLLALRGIKPKEQDRFLSPQYERDLHDPFLMMGIKEAVKRLKEAWQKKEVIGIFGDYDADGVPAAALLFDILTHHGMTVKIYIPSREEGYGLNRQGIEFLHKQGVTLMLTVDLGITGIKEVKYAKSLGIETIITDHHEAQQKLLPKEAVAIIDPKQSGERYPFKELSGGGVAFKLAIALTKTLKLIPIEQLKWRLDLVAICTFCDMVPLLGENRVLAKYGMLVLGKTKRLGLKALYCTAGIEGKEISPYQISFMIGPRINAPGRIDHVTMAYELLVADSPAEAQTLATKLEAVNRERQQLLQKVLDEAEKKVIAKKLQLKKVIMVDGEGWPEGIVGLVAGRLLEKYGRPTIVFGRQAQASRGSARSIEGFHLMEVLNDCQDYLMKHGGHAKAAGLTVANEHLELLYDRILKIAEKKLAKKSLEPKIICDAEIGFNDVTWELYEKLKKLEPFGIGNPRPIFTSENITLRQIASVGNGDKHLKFTFESGKQNYRAIGFSMGARKKECVLGKTYDLVYTIDEDDWLGGKNLELKLIDFRQSQ